MRLVVLFCFFLLLQSIYSFISVPKTRSFKLKSFRIDTGEDVRSGGKVDCIPNIATSTLALPLASIMIPSLLSEITDFSVTPDRRQVAIISLLLLKRVYLYSTAYNALDWSAKRAFLSPPSSSSFPSVEVTEGQDNEVGLGTRMSAINRELFADFSASSTNTSERKKEREKESQALYDSLDSIDGYSQALLVPILIAASLLTTYAFQSSGSGESSSNWILTAVTTNNDKESTEALMLLAQRISIVLPGLVSVVVCSLFSRIEIEKVFNNKEEEEEMKSKASAVGIASLGLAVLLSLSSVFSSPLSAGLPSSVSTAIMNNVWLVQNVLNTLLAVSISRVFAFNKLNYIAVALVGLVFYDYFFVNGLSQLTDGGTSIMEAVATAKLQAAGTLSSASSTTAATAVTAAPAIASTASTTAATASTSIAEGLAALPSSLRIWSPGFFQVQVGGGRVSDGLGLGDVVFPAMLAGWALKFDNRQRNGHSTAQNASDEPEQSDQVVESDESSSSDGNSPLLYPSAMAGFVIGCLLCEVFQTGAGQPALLYVVPGMFGGIASKIALSRGMGQEGWRWVEEMLAFEG